MKNRIMSQVERLMGLRYKSHPWHGVDIGDHAPDIVTSFIEMVPTDTVKYEIDKESGYLKIDRPQKYSNVVPALYGFIPQTFSGKKVAAFSNEKTGRTDLKGDGDPIDICILTEKNISHGDILVHARPIGGFRMIDGQDADDKIIAVMNNDAVYMNFTDICDIPHPVVDRLKHYFLTYKDLPGNKRDCEITHVYSAEEAKEIIKQSISDYRDRFGRLEFMLTDE
jgi:inorganic pyrophosphatase